MGLEEMAGPQERGFRVLPDSGAPYPLQGRVGPLLFRPSWGQNMADTQRTPSWAQPLTEIPK